MVEHLGGDGYGLVESYDRVDGFFAACSCGCVFTIFGFPFDKEK